MGAFRDIALDTPPGCAILGAWGAVAHVTGGVFLAGDVISKVFKTYGAAYMYDRNTDSVVVLTGEEYDELASVAEGELPCEQSQIAAPSSVALLPYRLISTKKNKKSNLSAKRTP